MTELENRGVEDILIAVVDGWKGFPRGDRRRVSANHRAGYASSISSTNSMDFASWKDRKPIAAELKSDLPGDRHAGRGPQEPLEDFDATGVWGRKYPAISTQRLAAQLGACHPVLRLSRRCAAHHLHHERHLNRPNAKLRRAVRTRGHFPTDEAAIKLLYLVLRQVAQTWKNAATRMVRG